MIEKKKKFLQKDDTAQGLHISCQLSNISMAQNNQDARKSKFQTKSRIIFQDTLSACLDYPNNLNFKKRSLSFYKDCMLRQLSSDGL